MIPITTSSTHVVLTEKQCFSAGEVLTTATHNIHDKLNMCEEELLECNCASNQITSLNQIISFKLTDVPLFFLKYWDDSLSQLRKSATRGAFVQALKSNRKHVWQRFISIIIVRI